MKKIIFLLIAVFLAGLVFGQDAAHPPGVFTLEAAMSGYSIQEAVVTPDTVLTVMPVTAELSSIQAMANDNFMARPPNYDFKTYAGFVINDFYMRC